MSDETTHDGREDATKGTATTAMVLWVIVLAALAYGLVNTFATALDLFTG